MRTRTAVRRIALLSFLLLLACQGARAQDEATPAAPEPTIAVDSDRQSDAAIARRVQAILEEIGELDDVRVEVNAGVVTLRGTALDAETAREAGRLAGRVQGVVTVRNEIEQETSVEERLVPVVDRLRQRLAEAVNLLPLLGIALLVLLLFLVIGLWIARLRWPWDRMTPNAFVADLVRQVVRLGFIAAGVVVALDILGATALLGTMLGAAGIVGLAVGFAVRDTIENYLASILLSIRQPFRPNDHVMIDDYEGHVVRLTSRATILMTLDGNHVRMPNARVFKGVIVNYTRNPERRFDFRLGVDADSNLSEALTLGTEALEQLEFVLADPAPVAWVEEVGDSNVILWFGAWIDQRESDLLKARSEAIRLTKRALIEAGFALPEPIYRLRFDDQPPDGLGLPRTAPDPGDAAPALQEDPEAASARQDNPVADKVAAERREESAEDLLDPSAPSE